jgi:predicted MFS family arabinose efflux permease
LTKRQTLLLATVVGAVVANIYYIQPLLPALATDFHTSATGIGIIAMLTQFGTAAGMLVFVPMGDTHDRRSLAFRLLLVASAGLALFAVARSELVLAVAALAVGITSSAVHVLVPFAAHLAPRERKGAAVGIVLSGLLVGILLARVVSGYIAAWLDWRAVFVFGCVLMSLAAILVRRELPEDHPTVRLKWAELVRSALVITRDQPVVREATLVSALLFFSFSAFWTTLAFFLQSGSYRYGTAAVGSFGLVGAAGALAAPLLGKVADRFSARHSVIVTVLCAVVSFVVMMLWGTHLAGLVVGVVLLDLGMQGTHVSNQTRIYSVLPEAKSRLNMVYMFTYFLAGAAGSLVGAKVWQEHAWRGVCILGICVTATAAISLAVFHDRIRRTHA